MSENIVVPVKIRRVIESSVQRGAALLDRKRPGWHEEIEIGVLRMESGCNCVYGQLHAEEDIPGFKYGFGITKGERNYGYWYPLSAEKWIDECYDCTRAVWAVWAYMQEEWLRAIYVRRQGVA